MNAVIWYCDICDKSNIIKSKAKHVNSKSQKHKEKFSLVGKEHEFIRPDIIKIDYKTISFARDCYNKTFHTLAKLDEYKILK